MKTTYKVINGKVTNVSENEGWYFHQEFTHPIPNINYGEAKSREEADNFVAAGTHRWKHGQGGVLALVRADSDLLMWECWLQEDPPRSGRWKEI